MATSGHSKPFAVVDGERWVSSWDWAGGTLAMAVSTPTTLPELLVQPLPRRRGDDLEQQGQPSARGDLPETRVTELTSPLLVRTRLSEPQAFVARSADGTEVPCWAMPPIGVEAGRRYPTLLNVHGGPFTSYGHRFFDEFQIEAGAGFGVLYCNPAAVLAMTRPGGEPYAGPSRRTTPGRAGAAWTSTT